MRTRENTANILLQAYRPVVLLEREMRSNSAFQHSTSDDDILSFTGQPEVVVSFTLGMGLGSLSLA